jgi:hypothetical protein
MPSLSKQFELIVYKQLVVPAVHDKQQRKRALPANYLTVHTPGYYNGYF